MKKILVISIFSIIYFTACSKIDSSTVTVTITNLPINHPLDEDVYIVGDFNSWDPCDINYKLTKNENNTHSIELTGSGTINFKFTRGNWDKVEKGPTCQEIPFRTFTFGSNDNYSAIVYYWADLCDEIHTAEPNVEILDDNFYMPQLNRSRHIWIYLPPDYHTTANNYPVLYMQDGRNLFDNYYSFSGEWEIDESLNDLFNSGDNGCIVVGINNGGSERDNEYSPWVNATYGGGDGDLYAQFIVNTLKPYIDDHYRTLSNRENTGIMGSSMGALISFYTGIKYQSVFSKIGVFSPSFWFSDQCYTFAEETPKEYSMRLYFLGGGQEWGVIHDCNSMIDVLLNNNYLADEIVMKAFPDGQHSVWFWRQEFPEAYQWLYSP